MHNISGVTVKEEKPISYEGLNLYNFNVSYPNKSRVYYSEDKATIDKWVAVIRKVTDTKDLTDDYEVVSKLGNGKFGLVKLGTHKETGRKVAIKIMKKEDMTEQDMELCKAELEIMKICQHPYIINIYDYIENEKYIYIIMEYCPGGDLFSYIEKRGFRLSEERAATLVAKISIAINYCHHFGVVHRDLKPENILMTSENDDAEIKLLDFGLSKIIGPGETCTEPFGTLSYVAPEVLTEKPYGKSVDVWSIGIIAYLVCVGCLPFDHETSEKEIAKQTINDPVPFHYSIWKKLSKECKDFVIS